MSEAFRDISPDAPELQPIISGLFAEYAARYGDYFSRDAEVELTEWYLPPQGLFIVLERDGEIIATGAYKPKDPHTAEIKRIWTHRRLRQQGWPPWLYKNWSVGRCWQVIAIFISPPVFASRKR